MERFGSILDDLFPEMVAWRRHLHQHPELSFHENKTAEYIYGHLTRWGIEAKKGVGGHGVVGVIRGSEAGPTVALRADMDALPIQDQKQCEYASKVPGVMHACGHDAHTATLLAVAKSFQEQRGELKGNVVCIFQPAEEFTPGGAAPMIREGVLDGVDVIYGVHLWTPFPSGSVYTATGRLMAAADEFQIEITGKGGHAGLPHETVDSIVVASQLVMNLQTIVSRNVDPAEPSVVSVGFIQAGTAFNVIAGTCAMIGTVRSFNEQVRDLVRARIEQIAAETCRMHGAECRVDYKAGYPPVINDETEAERFFRTVPGLFPAENVRRSPLIMAGEDFAYYLQKIPGCFMLVGAGNEQAGIIHPHHHPKFDIDETAMLNAAKLLTRMALSYLHGE
ncbi:M20 family metallopeptidase [Ferviditalea candida]|uniref:M20 family metallopeptidase n=1 Tax=Ferviditalea candida TaxID=3108399 RepID=A0ABU5ZPY9_9BACL|nr:M20 family metallopeptidase [Paenibacillaceae bacterium T2]